PRQARQAVGAASLGGGEPFLRQLGWRDFAWHLLHHAPDMDRVPLRPEFAHFPWRSDDDVFEAWRQGRTGYPIVDAGMRCLWRTGWMHNRVRMIVASFLVKDLLIPWQRGAAWFLERLVDADLAINAASWQWVAGCGTDAAPYFRIFNPVLQGEKFDPRGRFVRQWVPELAGLPDLTIHRPWQAAPAALAKADITLGQSYPPPVVDHGAARRRALLAYQQARGAA
ncbi:MAG: FAD-binding domain-containing protein, partial [Alphaproteobacteria bacterium]|nr:FAD-binding domain-containing protein [Alphaproteobacteria bacterium]